MIDWEEIEQQEAEAKKAAAYKETFIECCNTCEFMIWGWEGEIFCEEIIKGFPDLEGRQMSVDVLKVCDKYIRVSD